MKRSNRPAVETQENSLVRHHVQLAFLSAVPIGVLKGLIGLACEGFVSPDEALWLSEPEISSS